MSGTAWLHDVIGIILVIKSYSRSPCCSVTILMYCYFAPSRGARYCNEWCVCMSLCLYVSLSIHVSQKRHVQTTTTTTTVLRPFVWDYPGEPVPEETLTHPPSWSSSNLYQLLPFTTIHSILLVQIMCLEIFLHDLFPCPLWSTSWSGALHLIFHTFLHPISVFFAQHITYHRNLFCCTCYQAEDND